MSAVAPVASTHRGHGHPIANGCDVKGMMAEIYGENVDTEADGALLFGLGIDAGKLAEDFDGESPAVG